jgi:hypothetical protein
MNTFLCGQKIRECLLAEAGLTRRRALISSAFCTSAQLIDLISTVSPETEEKALVVRWRISDFLMGASDPEIFHVCAQNEWPLYANANLHAKIYLFDKSAVVGSANLTSRGLSGSPPAGNIEAATYTDSPPEISDISKWFKHTLHGSYIVDEEVYNETVRLIHENKVDYDFDEIDQTFGRSLEQKLQRSKNIELLCRDMIFMQYNDFINAVSIHSQSDDVQHDLQLLKLSPPFTDAALMKAFTNSPGYRWLDAQLSEPRSFGELSSRLHNSLADDPAPYRKTVKIFMQNILSWLEALASPQHLIERPGHSQIVSKRK